MTPKKEHHKEALLQALRECNGIVTRACSSTGLSRETFYRYFNEDKEFAKEAEEIKEVALDFVEGKLFEQINAGNIVGIIFYLKTKGKARGYTENQEEKTTSPKGKPDWLL